jgi:hypothetical protein
MLDFSFVSGLSDGVFDIAGDILLEVLVVEANLVYRFDLISRKTTLSRQQILDIAQNLVKIGIPAKIIYDI